MPEYREDADHDAGYKLRMHKVGKPFQILRRISPRQEKPEHALPQHQRQDGRKKQDVGVQSEHRNVQQDDRDGGNPHVDVRAIQHIEKGAEWRNRRHIEFVWNKSLKEATLATGQLQQRSAINNAQCPEAERPEAFPHFAQKRFVLWTIMPIRIEREEVSKGEKEHTDRKDEDSFKIVHAKVLLAWILVMFRIPCQWYRMETQMGMGRRKDLSRIELFPGDTPRVHPETFSFP